MADISVNFFWQGLIISIILSILLTIGLNLWARKRSPSNAHFGAYYDDEYFDRNSEKNNSGSESEKSKSFDDEPRTKTGGMIMIGPIPIAFGSGGVRFDKKAFKYALAFFLIVTIVWFLIFRF